MKTKTRWLIGLTLLAVPALAWAIGSAADCCSSTCPPCELCPPGCCAPPTV